MSVHGNNEHQDGGVSDPLSSALAQLRLKLLDLTGRNRLINFKHTPGKSLQFVEGQPSSIYQKLVESNTKPTISILGLPEPSRHDWIERNGRLQRPEHRDWAKSQGISTSYDISQDDDARSQVNLRSLMYPEDLAKHCRKIEREAILAIEETGANMLFLVLGFLEFPDQKDSDRTFAAPLISIPVTLIKKEAAGIQSFSLQFTGDDIEENLSLREKLKNDFGLVLPDLDEDQIDVDGYFNVIDNIIQRLPGFALKRRVSLCLLSFTNMLLVRDMEPAKWPANGLLNHPIVREVFEGRQGDVDSGIGMASEHPVEEGHGAAIPLVYDADSSQHSALVDVLALKKNMVIEGPPGTGKSQTITNLIAACLAEGKKVLFVAEKMAALEVVKNRLSLAGLDPFILELHSNKTNKKRVLEEVAKRIAYRASHPADLPRLLEQMESHRKDLKAYSELINSIAFNAFGLTLHQVMWKAEKHRCALTADESMLSQFSISDATNISQFELFRRMDCLGFLGAQYLSVGSFDSDSTFWGFFPNYIIPGDEVRLANLFKSSMDWVRKLVDSADTLAEILGGNVYGLTLEFSKAQIDILIQMLSGVNNELPLHLVPGFYEDDKTGDQALIALTNFEQQLQRYHALQSVIQSGLKNEASVTQSRLVEVKSLHRAGEVLGVALGNQESLSDLHQNLLDDVEKLKAAAHAIKEFTGNKGIPFDGSRQKLSQLLNFTNLVVDAPEEYLHLQKPGLTRDGAVQGIEAISALQERWAVLQRELDEQLYIDTLPSDSDIKQAILTLREGDAWYRIFQGRWRSAVSLHKSIQRTKRKLAGSERLAELESVASLLNLKEKWRTEPVWGQCFGTDMPTEPFALDGYLALAKWNRSVKLAAEDIQTVIIDPITFTPDQARLLRREFSTLKVELVSAISELASIDAKLTRLHEVIGAQYIEKFVSKAEEFLTELHDRLEWLTQEAVTQASLLQVISGCEAALERVELRSAIGINTEVQRLLGDLYAGVDTDISGALEALAFGRAIDGLNLSAQVKARLRVSHPVQSCELIKTAFENVYSGLSSVHGLANDLQRFGQFELQSWTGIALEEDLQDFADALLLATAHAVKDSDLIIPWSLYVTRRKEANELGLKDFVDLLESERVLPIELANAYAYSTYATIIREAFRHLPQLGRFTGLKHNQIRDEFKRLDKEVISLRGQAIGYDCIRKAVPPSGRNGARVDDKSEMVLLNYLLPQQRPRMPVRKMLMRAGVAIQSLKPCFMMGPQAVAQYLTPGAIKFDLVIMDEASQLKPEEAIGAIARGSQLVVVGDPKQLPPTSFFSRMSQSADDDEQFSTTDAESILDVCSSHFQPIRSLRWHYRSQHHSLIAFSNHNFYRGNLIIFPSPYGQGGKLGVRAIYLADAVYENQTNLREAKRVVDAVIEHIAHRSDESLGIVTLNIKQRDLIAELLEDRLRTTKGADAYREHWSVEGQPLFIKNLENVQGDERDAIIISTTFGKTAGSSAVRQNFGPISRQGGWRRLNVLFTRAKRSIALYTSLRPEDIVIDGKTPDGTKALRNYLEYARTGSLTVAEETGRDPDSDFEISVTDMLRQRGYEVTPQLGVAGYRIDIAVRHPDAQGSYLAAIECDGASYHSALSVRDRDRIRQEILESLGWRGRIWRVWSTDWFRTPRQETEKLISFLDGLRKNWKPEHSSGESWTEEGIQSPSSNTSGNVNAASPQQSYSVAQERDAISPVLIDFEEDIEVKTGDVVKYVDTAEPDDLLIVQITVNRDDFANGLVSESRPLAQTLLGAVIGDEVALHLPGTSPKIFRVIDIKKS